MTEEVLRKVLSEKRSERIQAEAAAEARKAAAFAVPEIANAQREYVFALHKSMLRGGMARKQEAEEARKAYTDALAEYGYTEDDFFPRVRCTKCGDTGMCDGHLCECTRDAFIRALGVACDISPEGFTLEDFDPNAIKSAAQCSELEKKYKRMLAFAERFPENNHIVLVFTGKSGTGKTQLATALARTVLRRGHSATIMSAMAFNALMLKCHTSPYAEREGILHDVMSAEMLVIDDLGTEPKYNNVTCEYLLLVTEERIAKRLTTVVTTNLSPLKILQVYNERIYSRLFDKRQSLTLTFGGDDLRLL